MPTHAASQIAIETRFDTKWVDQTVSVRYEADPRKKPVDKFIRLSVRNLQSRRVGISGGKILYRRPGFINMQCFVLTGDGTQNARVMADTAIAIFEGQSFSSITCRESELREIGDDSEGFWQVVARVFFDFDFEVTVT